MGSRFDRTDIAVRCLTASRAGVWEYDIAHDKLSCSTEWYSILGLADSDFIKSIDDFKQYIHEDDIAIATEVNFSELNFLIERDEPYGRDFRIVRPDAAVRWVHSVASLVQEPDRIIALGCLTDITDTLQAANRRASEVSEHVLRSSPKNGFRLSGMERECLHWVSLGKTAWETSIILARSQRTIEFHLANATSKLGATNKVHAVATAIRLGIL